MERSTRDDVAVFVDFENVYVSVREKFDATPNFELIMDRCEDYGRIVIARAYADWYRYPRVTSALFANGVEPMYVPTYYYDRDMGRTGRPIKNSVDIHLCIDAMRTLYTEPNIKRFVLVTGDRDFIPLVNAIRQRGRDVIVIGIGGAASSHLAQSADEFLFYEQIADLKPVNGTPQRPAEEPRKEEPRKEEPRKEERRERTERVRTERAPKPEVPAATNGKVEVVEEPAVPEPITAVPVAPPPAPIQDAYATLVDAVKLARQRGFVANLGSLKVIMRELDSNFHESKVKDGNGRGFSKFKDFVKEAERQEKVQLFTNGTVTEVFLPGEDPSRLSQFADDLVSQEAEREIETELAQAEAAAAPEVEITHEAEPIPVAIPELSEVHTDDIESEPGTPLVIDVPAEPIREFGDREWDVFRASMLEFSEPVRFADIFNSLRGLRNQEVVELTNNELKELVKRAINQGMLQRTGRGARAYYRLSPQYRTSKPEEPVAVAPDEGEGIVIEADSAVQDAPMANPQTAGASVSSEATSSATRRRRARRYTEDTAAQPEGKATEAPVELTDSAPTATEADGTGASTPEETMASPAEATPAATLATPEADVTTTAPAGRASKRRTRRKPAAQATAGTPAANESADAPTVEAVPTPKPETGSAPDASHEPAAATSTPRGTAAKAESEAPDSAQEAADPEGTAAQNATRKRRRRKKAPTDNDGTSTEG